MVHVTETRKFVEDRADCFRVRRYEFMGEYEEIVVVEGDGEEDQFDGNALDHRNDDIAFLDFQLILCEKTEVLV